MTTKILANRVQDTVIRLVITASLVNLFSVPIIADSGAELIGVVLAGFILGQWGLLAIWGVFARQPIAKRTLTAYGLMLPLWIAVGLGILMTAPSGGGEVFAMLIAFALVLPLLLFATQIPLWLMRYVLRASIVASEDSLHKKPPEAQQFRLLHIFGAMTLVALLLTGAQWGMTAADAGFRGENPIVLLTPALAAFMALGALAAVPTLLTILGLRRLGRGAISLVLYSGAATIAICLVFSAIPSFRFSSSWFEMFFAVGLLCFSILATMAAALIFFRRQGYSLAWSVPWQKKLATEPQLARVAEREVTAEEDPFSVDSEEPTL